MKGLAPGLLVAAPPLGDPNFERSVVLLASHGEEGAFGFVINGREIMTLAELVVRAEIADVEPDIEGVVRLGGPVSTDQVWLLYRKIDAFAEVEGQFEIGPSMMATASRRVLELVAKGLGVSSVVAFAGYAGWAPNQLEEEIRQGAWLPTDVDASIVFDVPRDEVWTRAFGLVGANPMSFTSRTIGSA